MTELMSSGIELMIVGMGIVFSFLAMLVLAINGMSWLVQRFFPELPAPLTQIAAADIEKPLIAAITAAVHQHRKTHSS